ncbi:Uncharacterized protein OBRU01_16079, partial [Operophtera brumata]
KPPKLVKSINHIFNSQRTPQLRLVSEDENLEKVARQLEQQKINERQLPATISTHDIHQYTICYTLLAVVVIAALVWVIRKRGLCNTKATYATAAEHPEPEAIKLQSQARSPTQCDTTTNFQPFIDKVLEIAQENEGFTSEKIKHELNTLLSTRYDTTATSIIYCLMLLGYHQDVQDKLSRE